MPSGQFVNLKEEKAQIKRDMSLLEFKSLTTLIQNTVQQDWIRDKKLAHISKN